MSRVGRVAAETDTAWRTFARRRTAVFFTFFFPALVILIFGALIRTDGGGSGLFAEPPGYYVPGYLAVVVLFTPLSRVGSTVARYREGNRFEKLAATPLTRAEWLVAHTVVNAAIIGLASALLLALVLLVTDARIHLSALLVPFVVLGVAVFCGVGALIGSLADSQDGVIAASNALALPLLFLSETFVTPDMLPGWFRPLVGLSPLTYFARGVREATYRPAGATGASEPWPDLAILAALAAVFFAAGAYALPRTE